MEVKNHPDIAHLIGAPFVISMELEGIPTFAVLCGKTSRNITWSFIINTYRVMRNNYRQHRYAILPHEIWMNDANLSKILKEEFSNFDVWALGIPCLHKIIDEHILVIEPAISSCLSLALRDAERRFILKEAVYTPGSIRHPFDGIEYFLVCNTPEKFTEMSTETFVMDVITNDIVMPTK